MLKLFVLALSSLLSVSAAPSQLQPRLQAHSLTNTYDSRTDHDSSAPPIFLEANINRSIAHTPSATVSNIKYGPFTVPAMGMLHNNLTVRLTKPCTDCFVVALQADLLSAATGKSVNINEGAWLHHMALFNTGWLGTGERDPVCRAYNTRIFASGNERTPIRLNGRYEYGLEIGASDNLLMIVELMNESQKQQEYFVQMTYEFLPRAAAPTYKPARAVWLDVSGCYSRGEVPAQEGQYELKSSPWQSTFKGRLLSATGHTHDGGEEVLVYKNGQVVCRAAQLYDASKTAYVSAPAAGAAAAPAAPPPPTSPAAGTGAGVAGHEHGGHGAAAQPITAQRHISDTSTCLDFGSVKVGDELVIGAKYDTAAHPLDRDMHGGGNRPIMGISVVYIGEQI